MAIPAQVFYDSDEGRHLVSWAFCKERAVLEAAIDRLTAAELSKEPGPKNRKEKQEMSEPAGPEGPAG